MSERLFDPQTTVPTPCPVRGCSAIRFPGQERVISCDIDRARALGHRAWRPAGCLNGTDPQTTPWPEGF
jgi:hypothetical protein